MNITFNLYPLLFYFIPHNYPIIIMTLLVIFNQIILDGSIVIYILFIFDSIHEQSGGGLLFSMLQ